MINLLFVALEFPPIQNAGAFRALRFVTHLPDFGIRPIVVCFNPYDYSARTAHILNLALAERIPRETAVFHLDVSAIENDGKRWHPPREGSPASKLASVHSYSANELFDRIRAKFDIDVVYATCPPFDVDRLAIAAKAFFQCPLLLDMRDAWSLWGCAPHRTWFHYRATRKRERRLLRTADAVTSVTPQLIEMEREVARSPGTTFHWVPNGHDQPTPPSGTLCISAGKTRYRIAYVGQFYFGSLHENADGVIPWYKKSPHRWLHYHATRQRWIYRTPYFFFRAWATLRDGFPELKDRFEFHHVGELPDWLPVMAAQFDLTEYCTWHGVKSWQETQLFLANCDATLSTSIKVRGGEDYCLASKSFDYIAARKLVLGFVCDGAQRDFLQKSNVSLLFDPDDASTCAEKLRKLVQHGASTEPDQVFLETFSSTSTTERLADVVRHLAASRPSKHKSQVLTRGAP